jgi:phenylalanyl-tRNA synthetase beta chain
MNDDCFDYGLALGKKIGRDEIKEVVRFGLLKKKVTKLNKVSQEVFYAEFDWDYVLKNINLKKNYTEISKFPAVYRDLSLVISKQVSFEEVEQVAKKTERKLLKEISVFDIYEGDRIEQNKKAYAMTFVLQDQHKTLNDKTIDKTMQRLMNAFKNELGAVIRGEK